MIEVVAQCAVIQGGIAHWFFTADSEKKMQDFTWSFLFDIFYSEEGRKKMELNSIRGS